MSPMMTLGSSFLQSPSKVTTIEILSPMWRIHLPLPFELLILDTFRMGRLNPRVVHHMKNLMA